MDIPTLPPLEYIGDKGLFSQLHANFILILAKQGYSLRACAGAACIPYRVVAQWVDLNPAFRVQVEIAMAQRVFHLEHRLLNTEDPTQGKILMQALRRAAPEVWADPKEAPPDVANIPTAITLTVVNAEPRALPGAVEQSAPEPNAPTTTTTQ